MKKKTIIIGSLILVALIAVMAVLWSTFKEKPVEGSKTITIEVVNDKEESKVYELKTDAEYLRQAMDEAKKQGLTFEGEEGQYGLNLLVINGLRADFNKDGAYWSIIVNGEYGMNGADTQPVKDGDAYKLVYTKAQ